MAQIKTAEQRERQREHNRRWRSANREKQREYERRSYEKNRQQRLVVEAERRTKRVGYYKQWYEKNKALVAAKTAKRRAARKQAIPPWFEQKQVAALYERAHAEGLVVDHIYPLQGKNICGLHCLANLQLLTPEENRKKGARWE